MTRNELIEAILTRTGVPAERQAVAHARYADLSDCELTKMNTELACMAAFGRKVKPKSPSLKT